MFRIAVLWLFTDFLSSSSDCEKSYRSRLVSCRIHYCRLIFLRVLCKLARINGEIERGAISRQVNENTRKSEENRGKADEPVEGICRCEESRSQQSPAASHNDPLVPSVVCYLRERKREGENLSLLLLLLQNHLKLT